MKDARLLLPLTEVMKIARLTSPLLNTPRQLSPRPWQTTCSSLSPKSNPLLDTPRQSSPRPWQTTCSSLSPKSNPKSVHSLLSTIAGSPSFSPNCSSPRKSASVYAAYLQSHFSVSQQKTLRSRARGYLSELRRAMCPVESHSSFCSPLSPTEFLAAASNLSSSTATGPDKVAYPMLKHLPRSGMDFLLHIFNPSWSSHSFPSIWKTSSIIPIHKMGIPLGSPASFRPISVTSCVSKLFERIILSRLLFFQVSNSILSPRQAGFRPG